MENFDFGCARTQALISYSLYQLRYEAVPKPHSTSISYGFQQSQIY